jgi:hypothetical protein
VPILAFVLEKVIFLLQSSLEKGRKVHQVLQTVIKKEKFVLSWKNDAKLSLLHAVYMYAKLLVDAEIDVEIN